MNRLRIYLTILCMFPALLFAKSCDSYWNEFLSKHEEKPKYSEFLKFWQNEVGDDCKKSAGYYYYLADTSDKKNNSEEGLKAARYAMRKYPSSNYTPLLKSVILSIKAVQDYQKNISFRKIEGKYLKLMKEYPKSSEILARYAASSLLFKKYAEAKKYALKSNKIQPNKTAFLVLIQTSFHDKKYKEVILYANRAAGFDKYLYAHQNTMTAVAISYASLGKFKTAENAMNILIAKNPRVVDDENFKKAVKYLNYLYTKSKEKEESKGGVKNAK